MATGCNAVPAGGAASATAPPPAELAARLPSDAAGFQRGQTLPLGDRAGLEIAYATSGRTAVATVEVIRSREPVLADGAVTAAFETLVEDALRQLPPRRMQEQRRFVLPASGPAPGSAAGPPPLRCAATEGSWGRERVWGLLCAGAVSGNLLRLRVAMPQRDPPAGDAEAFAAAILDALRG